MKPTRAQLLSDPDQRQARDAFIRTIFANPDTRHHEAVAEAELDTDYSASPIVMGTANAAVTPGRLWPDQITVQPAEGAPHDLRALASQPRSTPPSSWPTRACRRRPWPCSIAPSRPRGAVPWRRALP